MKLRAPLANEVPAAAGNEEMTLPARGPAASFLPEFYPDFYLPSQPLTKAVLKCIM
jgi:hypothetical protein